MPRRHASSVGCVVFATLLLAVIAPAHAQSADDADLRGSLSPNYGNARDSDSSAGSDTSSGDNTGAASGDDNGSSAGPSDNGQQGNSGGANDNSGQGSRSTTPPASDDDDQPPNPDSADQPQASTGAGSLGGIGDQPTASDIEEPPEAAPNPAVTVGPSFVLPQTTVGEASLLESVIQPYPQELDPYVPIGVKLGSFTLYPEVDFGTIFTDNVLDTLTDVHSDYAPELQSKLRLQSNWSRHSFSAEFNSDTDWYHNFPEEDDKDYQGILRGRIDVSRQTHLGIEAEASQTQAGRDSVNITNIIGTQVNLHEAHVTGSVDHTFNRLTLKLSETYADYTYDQPSETLLPGTVINPFQGLLQDYTEELTTLRGTYQFQDALAGFVEGSFDTRNYDQAIDSFGDTRTSAGYTLVSGVDLNYGTLKGEISAGYGAQQPDFNGFKPVSGPLLNGDVMWLPSPATKLEFLARSQIDESTLVNSLGAIDRYYELSLQHAFWKYLVLGAFGSYEIADFIGADQVDQRTREGLTAEYYFNPVVSLYGLVQHTDYTSTIEASDFTENQIRMGVRLRR